MTIIRPTVVGAVVAFVGHGVAVGVTMAAAITANGGPNADLGTGEMGRVLSVVVMTYGIAQIVLLGVCIALRWRLGPPSSPGLIAGWVLGLAATIVYVGGGFSI